MFFGSDKLPVRRCLSKMISFSEREKRKHRKKNWCRAPIPTSWMWGAQEAIQCPCSPQPCKNGSLVCRLLCRWVSHRRKEGCSSGRKQHWKHLPNKQILNESQAGQCTPIILALKRLRKDNLEIKASLAFWSSVSNIRKKWFNEWPPTHWQMTTDQLLKWYSPISSSRHLKRNSLSSSLPAITRPQSLGPLPDDIISMGSSSPWDVLMSMALLLRFSLYY